MKSTLHKQDECCTEGLLPLLARQKFLVNQLGALASRQDKAVRDENVQGLLELLAQRQDLIDRVLSTQREIAPLLSRPAAELREPSPERDEASGLIEEIQNALAEVMRHDEEARCAIQAMQDRTRDEMKSFGRTQQARKAYSPHKSASAGAANPRFSDRKG